MAGALYLDTSAVLRALLERGVSPELEARIRTASTLVASRLSLVETSRALHRIRRQGAVEENKLAEAEREIGSVWSRCQLWELSISVCEMARRIAPGTLLRTLDALHLATFVLARQQIADLELVTADVRLADSVRAI
jgi:predicted nucleic acid-binding protein